MLIIYVHFDRSSVHYACPHKTFSYFGNNIYHKYGGINSSTQPDIHTFIYYVTNISITVFFYVLISKSVFKLSSYSNSKSQQFNNDNSQTSILTEIEKKGKESIERRAKLDSISITYIRKIS